LGFGLGKTREFYSFLFYIKTFELTEIQESIDIETSFDFNAAKSIPDFLSWLNTIPVNKSSLTTIDIFQLKTLANC